MILIAYPDKFDAPEVISAAEALDWKVYQPPKQNWIVPRHLLSEEGSVYGDEQFCRSIASQMNWKLIDNPPNWIATLPKEYTKRTIDTYPLSKARQITEKTWMKSLEGVFVSQIYSSGKDLPDISFLNDTKVLVSDPMNFISKFRCVVKDRKVISVHCYFLNGGINTLNYYSSFNDEVGAFVNSMLDDNRVECASSIIIDVGRFKDEKFDTINAIISSNPLWSSRVFNCEKAAVLDALKSSTRKR